MKKDRKRCAFKVYSLTFLGLLHKFYYCYYFADIVSINIWGSISH